MKTVVWACVGCCIAFTTGVQAQETLNVAIVRCYSEGFKRILPMLEKKLGLTISVETDHTHEETKQRLAQGQIDVLIDHVEYADVQRHEFQSVILPESLRVIERTYPVLWCDQSMASSISYRQFLQKKSLILATTQDSDNPMSHIWEKLKPTIPSSIRIKPVKGPYMAYQAVKTKQADCAIVSKNMLEQHESYLPIPNYELHSIAAVAKHSKRIKQATALIEQLSTPMFQAKLTMSGFDKMNPMHAINHD